MNIVVVVLYTKIATKCMELKDKSLFSSLYFTYSQSAPPPVCLHCLDRNALLIPWLGVCTV